MVPVNPGLFLKIPGTGIVITNNKKGPGFAGTGIPVARAPTPGIWLLGGWLAEWLTTRARVCSVYVQLCGWQAGSLACSFESACVRTLQLSFY